MKPRITVPDTVRESIRHMPPLLKKKVRAAFDEIGRNPKKGKALIDQLDGYYRYPLGKYHIIYQIEKKKPVIRALGPRKIIYQELALQIVRKHN